MLVHSLTSKYARFVVIVRQMYWTPPPLQTIGPPLLKSDDLFFREPRNIGHVPGYSHRGPVGPNQMCQASIRPMLLSLLVRNVVSGSQLENSVCYRVIPCQIT